MSDQDFSNEVLLRLVQASLEFNATILAVATSTLGIKQKQRDPARIARELTQAFTEYQQAAGDIVRQDKEKNQRISKIIGG